MRASLSRSIFLITALMACNAPDSPNAPPQLDFWTKPNQESYFLFFDSSSVLIGDSILVGKIQYRLDRARLVRPELDSATVNLRWRPYELGAFFADSLFAAYDPSTFIFGNKSLDSLLRLYRPDSSTRRDTYVTFYYPAHYNLPVLAQEFKKVPEVISATQIRIGGIFYCIDDVHLSIENNKFRFVFSRTGPACQSQKEWIVDVVDDNAVFVSSRIY